MSKKTEWEEMLDKMLKDYADNVYFSGDPKRTLGTNEVTIKQFISDLLAKEKMELVERIKKTKFKMNVDSYLKLVQEWDGKNYDVPFDNGYNQALNNILSALKSEEKEEVGEE